MSLEPAPARPTAGKKAALSAAAIAAACAAVTGSIMTLEGDRNRTYLDIVGVPTYCYGETLGAGKVGDFHSNAECKTKLAQSLVRHATAMAKCITVDVPPPSLQALISFDYNVGEGNFCKSTLVKKLNAGDLAGACRQINESDAGKPQWDIAGGKRVRGLTLRRAQERSKCEEGVYVVPFRK